MGKTKVIKNKSINNKINKTNKGINKSKTVPKIDYLSLNNNQINRISKSKIGKIINEGEFIYNIPSYNDPKNVYNITQKLVGNQIKMTCDCIKQFVPNGERTFCKHITTVISKIFIGFKDGMTPIKKKSIEELIVKLSIL